MPFIPMYTFHRCLSLLAMARILKEQRRSGNKRQGKETKYINMGKKVLGKIKNWIEQGNQQSRHYEPLLEAELAAYQDRREVALEKYQLAVDMATDDGFIQDVALANKRYRVYLLSQCDDTDDENVNLQSMKNVPPDGDVKKAEEEYKKQNKNKIRFGFEFEYEYKKSIKSKRYGNIKIGRIDKMLS